MCGIFPVRWDRNSGKAAVHEDLPAFTFNEEAEFAIGEAEVSEKLGCRCV